MGKRFAVLFIGLEVVAYASLGAGDLIGHEVVKAVAHATGKTPAQVKTCPDRSSSEDLSL